MSLAGPAAVGASEFAPLPDALKGCTILVVDDNSFNRAMIGALLGKAGFSRLHYAASGLEALQLAARLRPDLIILDIMMPGMDGTEVLRRLRAEGEERDVPVLVQTGLTGSRERGEIFENGATDLINKPINPQELVSRVAIHLQNRLLINDLRAYRQRLETELMLARSVFEHLMPPQRLISLIADTSGCRLFGRTEASQDLGGDLWGALPLEDGKFALFVADVAGRGITAALVALRLHTVLRTAATRSPPGTSPGEFLTGVNADFAALLDPGQYATVIAGIYDPRDGFFYYALAGANAPLTHGDAGQMPDTVPGMALGLAPDTRYETHRLPVPPGGLLLLYSNALVDLLTESAAEAERQENGERGILNLLSSVAGPDGLLSATTLMDRIRELRTHRRLEDDLTIVCVERPLAAAGGPA